MSTTTFIAVFIGTFIAMTLLKNMGKASPQAAKQLVNEGATLLDVRSPGEFSGGHVKGAKNIPVQELAHRLKEVPKGKPVVVYCLSGGRSGSAARVLKQAGYDVCDLGGMRRWPG